MPWEAFSNPWWPWLVSGFIATVSAFTAGFVIDETDRGKSRRWLIPFIATLGTGGVLAIIVGLVRIVLSGLPN
jgi:hypothetical protein